MECQVSPTPFPLLDSFGQKVQRGLQMPIYGGLKADKFGLELLQAAIQHQR